VSTRDIEDLLAARGILVSYESIRPWCIKFGPKYARRLKRKHRGFGDTFFIDEGLRVVRRQFFRQRAFAPWKYATAT
jgi:transposase-like protein